MKKAAIAGGLEVTLEPTLAPSNHPLRVVGQGGLVLKQSSRSEPCPVCGRDVDGDCRFGDGLILCHVGTRFGPPQALRIGDVINVAGRSWALIRTQAGYDGAAHEFRPNSERPKTRPPKRQRRQHRLTARSLMADAMSSVDAALSVPTFVDSTPDELRKTWALIETAVFQTSALYKALKEIGSHGSELRQFLDLLREASKQLSYQQRDALNFRTHYLGEIHGDQ